MDRILTPQQELFLALYTDPKSDTFSNAYQSAIKSGYEDTYARNITDLMPDWLLENIGTERLISKAEKNLDKFLSDDKTPNLQADMTKFTLERLNKKKYSTRTELTGSEGKDLFTNDEKENATKAIKEIIG